LHTAVVSVQTEKISEQSEDCLDQFIKIVDKKDEIENYKKELTLEKTGNSLDWWRIRQDKYPALAELAIFGDSASERIFSHAGVLVTNK